MAVVSGVTYIILQVWLESPSHDILHIPYQNKNYTYNYYTITIKALKMTAGERDERTELLAKLSFTAWISCVKSVGGDTVLVPKYLMELKA